MKWTDIHAIAMSLEDRYPTIDNLNLRYTDLRNWILAIPGFEGAPDGCNEKILEAIQMAWIDERD
jgi:FeS assembly protein IscX